MRSVTARSEKFPPPRRPSPLFLRSLATGLITLAAVLLLAKSTRHVLSLLDISIIAVAASLLTSIGASLLRDPRQFLTALFERIRYCIVVPLCVGTICLLIAIRIILLLFKLSTKIAIWLLVSISYFLLPIDIIPDFLIGLGQIDDLLLFIGIGYWALSAGLKSELRSRMALTRPETPFP